MSVYSWGGRGNMVELSFAEEVVLQFFCPHQSSDALVAELERVRAETWVYSLGPSEFDVSMHDLVL
jgi:hypothetical protein